MEALSLGLPTRSIVRSGRRRPNRARSRDAQERRVIPVRLASRSNARAAMTSSRAAGGFRYGRPPPVFVSRNLMSASSCSRSAPSRIDTPASAGGAAAEFTGQTGEAAPPARPACRRSSCAAFRPPVPGAEHTRFARDTPRCRRCCCCVAVAPPASRTSATVANGAAPVRSAIGDRQSRRIFHQNCIGIRSCRLTERPGIRLSTGRPLWLENTRGC